MQLWRDHQIHHDDRHHEADAHDPTEAKAVGLARIAQQGVTAVLRGIQRGEEHERPEAVACKVEVPHRLALPGALRQVTHREDADDVDHDDDQATQPEGTTGHRRARSAVRRRG